MVWRELLLLLTGTLSYPKNYKVLPFNSGNSEPERMFFFEEDNAVHKDKHSEWEEEETSVQSHPGVGQKKNKRPRKKDQLYVPLVSY